MPLMPFRNLTQASGTFKSFLMFPVTNCEKLTWITPETAQPAAMGKSWDYPNSMEEKGN